MNYVGCSRCGKQVSNDVGVRLIVRAFVECPECIERTPDIKESPKSSVNKLCELFGHKISQVALLICEIKASHLNRGKPNIMKCERCSWTLDLNNNEAVDTYLQHIQRRNFFRTLWNFFKR